MGDPPRLIAYSARVFRRCRPEPWEESAACCRSRWRVAVITSR